ncbi:hypothetical protein, partial [Streptomyces sp. NPDC058394]|uniref:hypothetical protein n=1 Tax=Streptomyces sp. NPDC058394 TaxID=3346477 RepID=UPI00365317E2
SIDDARGLSTWLTALRARCAALPTSAAPAYEAAHAGSWKAWLDGYGSAHTDTLAQTVSIPAGCKATLSAAAMC